MYTETAKIKPSNLLIVEKTRLIDEWETIVYLPNLLLTFIDWIVRLNQSIIVKIDNTVSEMIVFENQV